MNRKTLYALAAPLAALVLALVVTALALIAGGHNPLVAFGKMVSYCFSKDSAAVITNKSLPLFISGLAVAIGFKMNVFNIGVEGQYRLAAIIAAAAGAAISLPAPLHVAFVMVIAMAVGAAWAAIAGVLNVTRNVNIVISTIMLNGVVASLIGYLLKHIAHVKNQMRATTELPRSAWFPDLAHLAKGTNLWGFVIIAIIIGVVFSIVMNRTRFGFDLRASGINPGAAKASGVNPKAMVIRTMLISGGLAGLIGMPVLLSDAHKYTQDFPTGWGFAGIAVAIVGRYRAGGVALAAVLFAAIERAAQILPQPPLYAPKEIGTIMQGTMMLSAVVAYEVVRRLGESAAIRDAAAKAEAHTEPGTSAGAVAVS
jgi:general nucleoside transport system permease protein